MSISKFVFYLIAFTSAIVYSQQFFINPESAAFDTLTNCYFVSNFYGNSIIKIDSSERKSVFKKNISHPCGMIICENILYVVENPNKIAGYKISDGIQVLEVQIKEAVFLNDITYDNEGNLYVTDTRLNAVFQIDRSNGNYSLLVKTLMNGPNGIIYDKFNNHLLVCYFREKSTIDMIDIKKAKIEILVQTDIDNLDGITLDELGNCYVSSFGPGSFKEGFKKEGSIYKFNRSFKKKAIKIKTGLLGPADIYYNKKKKELAIPLFLDNRIEFLNLE